MLMDVFILPMNGESDLSKLTESRKGNFHAFQDAQSC